MISILGLAPSMTKGCISSPDETHGCGEKDVPMKQLDSPKKDEDTEEKPEKKPPSKDSPIRWASFVIYMIISTPMLIAMIGLTAGLEG